MLLIVDANAIDRCSLSKEMEKRGFVTVVAVGLADGLKAINNTCPAYALIELRLDDGNGLDLVGHLKKLRPDARIVILTGYGDIATAVAAAKAGAADYLPKPADADDIENTLRAPGQQKAPPPEKAKPAHQIRWETHSTCPRRVREKCI